MCIGLLLKVIFLSNWCAFSQPFPLVKIVGPQHWWRTGCYGPVLYWRMVQTIEWSWLSVQSVRSRLVADYGTVVPLWTDIRVSSLSVSVIVQCIVDCERFCVCVFYVLTEINYKTMTGSSQYKFGILAKIVKHLRVSVGSCCFWYLHINVTHYSASVHIISLSGTYIRYLHVFCSCWGKIFKSSLRLRCFKSFGRISYRAVLRRAQLWDCMSSVCLSVTIRYRDHIGWNSLKIISRSNSLRPVRHSLTPKWAIWCNENTPKIRVE